MMKSKWNVLRLLAAALLMFVIVACGESKPQVTAANLGTSVKASRIEEPKTTFKPSDHMIHLIVDVGNALPGTTVGAKWYDVSNGNRLLFETDAALDPFNTSADFALTSTNDWAVGNYQVAIYLQGAKERTLDFVVK